VEVVICGCEIAGSENSVYVQEARPVPGYISHVWVHIHAPDWIAKY